MKASDILKIICVIGFIFDFILVARSIHKKRSTEEGKVLFQQQKKLM